MAKKSEMKMDTKSVVVKVGKGKNKQTFSLIMAFDPDGCLIDLLGVFVLGTSDNLRWMLNGTAYNELVAAALAAKDEWR